MPKKISVPDAIQTISRKREKFIYGYLIETVGLYDRIKHTSVRHANDFGITRLS